VGCTSASKLDRNSKDYYTTVKEYTDRSEYYEGFMNVFQMQGTVLNSQVLNGQVEKKAQSFAWNESQRLEEQAKVDNSLRTQTTVFLSFYSPENKINNLDSASSIWRVFLDVNNKRYVGSVSTYVGFANEASLFYPYHSVFAKAYLVKFAVPMINIQDYPMKLTVTGTIGSDSLNFHPLIAPSH
jgi:hypothetical protein